MKILSHFENEIINLFYEIYSVDAFIIQYFAMIRHIAKPIKKYCEVNTCLDSIVLINSLQVTWILTTQIFLNLDS